MELEEIKQHVAEEVKNLRKYATKEELGKLDFSQLHPEYPLKCIYGQMTGSCYSSRATELIHKCANVHYSFMSIFDEECNFPINDRPRSSYYKNFTFLEWFIYNHPQHNEQIIKYLKGESEEIFI